MNDADVSKQIQQMVRFIRQEAEEKANEISVSAEEVITGLFGISTYRVIEWNNLNVLRLLLILGIQHWEVATSGSREEEDQTRVWAQREASRSS